MKKLADGTKVSSKTPTKMTSKGRILLTEKEIEKRAAEESEFDAGREEREILKNRQTERGSIGEQLEYIVENGIDAFIARDEEIRQKHPKPKKVKK